MLRPRASLQANNVRLCREVHNFAHVEPFPDRHEFRPGDIVYLYMELANFSCVPSPRAGTRSPWPAAWSCGTRPARWSGGPTRRRCRTRCRRPPQDYYRNFRLCVPTVPPGTYTLGGQDDRPADGREVQKTVELRVGASDRGQ